MKKVLIIGAGAMGAAFSFPLLDNNNKVTLTEPYNAKLLNKLLKKKKFHPSLKITLPKGVRLKALNILSPCGYITFCKLFSFLRNIDRFFI